MNPVEITVVVPFHAEKTKWIERCLESVRRQKDAPTYETILVLDRASKEISEFVKDISSSMSNCHVIETDHGDLGMARNSAISLASGRYVALLDGDDLFGDLWLNQAYDYIRNYRETVSEKHKDSIVLHPEYMVMFGSEKFIHRCFGDDHPDYDERDMIQWNLWSALAFASRDLFLKFPYKKAENGYGFEDHIFNCETIGEGVKHRCPPGSVHGIRLKHNESSLATRMVKSNAVIPRMKMFDKRTNKPVSPLTQSKDIEIPKSVHEQIMFLHHEIGEYELTMFPEMGVRAYPRQFVFEEQSILRDCIGKSKNVVIVRRLVPGGAEKYAVDWASSITDSVIIETEPEAGSNHVKDRAKELGIKVIPWISNPDWNQNQAEYAFMRGLIQAELDSVFVCNSPLGWGCVFNNAQVMAKNVIAATFAVIPFGVGFTHCPAFHLKKIPPNLTLVTDNEFHAKKLISYGDFPVVVIEPKCSYSGSSKRSTLDKSKIRVLWAGRGTQEKRPDLLPSLAAIMEGTADIHVWGDVKPMNSTENLKYRGPFKGFEGIDGTYDCYLMTSFMEGMPNTACEAILSGLNVVGPAVGGVPQLTEFVYDGKFDPVSVSKLINKACSSDSDQSKISRINKWNEDFNSKVLEVACK